MTLERVADNRSEPDIRTQNVCIDLSDGPFSLGRGAFSILCREAQERGLEVHVGRVVLTQDVLGRRQRGAKRSKSHGEVT